MPYRPLFLSLSVNITYLPWPCLVTTFHLLLVILSTICQYLVSNSLFEYIVQVPIVSDSTCGAQSLTITMDMLCAGGEQGKDACHVSNMSKLLSATPSSSSTTVQGDSGGPLTVEVAGRHTLAGIVSFGAVCGQVRAGL